MEEKVYFLVIDGQYFYDNKNERALTTPLFSEAFIFDVMENCEYAQELFGGEVLEVGSCMVEMEEKQTGYYDKWIMN